MVIKIEISYIYCIGDYSMNSDSNNPLTLFKSYFFNLKPYEFALLANVLGILLCNYLDSNEQNSFGNWLELLGQEILTVQAQGVTLSPGSVNYNTLNQILEQLNFRFEYIEDLLNYLKKKP